MNDVAASALADATPSGAGLVLRGAGPIRTLTISNPRSANSVTLEMHAQLATIWDELATDESIHAVVLTGEGRFFSAGGDMAMLARLTEDEPLRRRVFREAEDILESMLRFPRPLVAAINGPAVGLGASLAVAADVVLIADTASIADPHVKVGVVAGDGGAAMWPILTPSLRTREHLYLGDPISADLAVDVGLATRTVPAPQLMGEAIRVATRLAELPRRAFELTKRAANLHLLASVRSVMPYAIAAEHLTFREPEIEAFLTTRRP